MQIFISHIHEEKALAMVLKSWIESTFLGSVGVFVSSDGQDLPAGARWLEQVDKALAESRLFLVLVSPNSFSRPWIHFESGCGWIKRVPVVPICHSSFSPSSLSPPLSMFQALRAEDAEFPSNLIGSIATHLAIKQLPRLNYTEMSREIIAALENGVVENGNRAVSLLQSATAPDNEEELAILQSIANTGPEINLPASTIATLTGINIERTKFHLSNLEERLWLSASHYYTGQESTYRLAHEGRRHLISKGII